MGARASKCLERIRAPDEHPGASEAEQEKVKTKTVYNPEWTPNGIEGGVDTNKLPWIKFPDATGWFYKPLRASQENGMFSVVAKMSKGAVQPDLIHLGSVDFMVLSGKMTFPSGPMKGSLEEGVWAYIPAEAMISGLKAESDVEYVMNCYGPFAFLNADKSVKSLFTSSDIQAAAAMQGISLIPNTLAECMAERPDGECSQGLTAEPLAISQKAKSDFLLRAKEVASNKDAMNCIHYVDTKALKWFESMPGVGLKILRVSEETGFVTVMVRHNAAAPPHYHLGAADFFMLQGHLGYRAGPPEGYGPGTWFFEPAGARHEATQPVDEAEDTVYLANIFGPIQFDSGVGTPIAFVFSWMSYLQMAEANGFPLVKNQFPRDSSHLAVAASKTTKDDAAEKTDVASTVYNPEWNPTGIEGGVDTNKLPWIEFSSCKGWSYKPLRASYENGMFSLVCRLAAGTEITDILHLGACDFMVLSGKMTFPSGPMAGTLQEGVFAYIPADAVIESLKADVDVEYVMNCYGPLAFLNKDKSVKELVTSNIIQGAAAKRGITLIPSTLAECLQERPEEYKGPAEPLAIADPAKAANLVCEREGSTTNAAAMTNPHYVDTKALKWFESMPGVGLKILRVSEETGVITVMVRHNAAAPPHYHLGCADFFMMQGHLGYRAGPPEGYGPGTWFFEPAGARHESTQPVDEAKDTIYLANIYGPIQFDSGVGTPIAFVFSWMSYLQMAEANGFPLVKNRFPEGATRLAAMPGVDRKGKFDITPYLKATPHPETASWCMQQTMIRVKDPKKSLDFYTKVLGMRLLSVGEFPQYGFTVYFVGYVDKMDRPPPEDDEAKKFAYSMTVPGCIELTWNHGTEVDEAPLIYNTGNADSVGTKDGKAVKGGFGHLGITVPDVYAACDHFKASGAEFKKSPNSGGMKGLAFVKDPDGYAIEILPYGKAFPFPTKDVDCSGVTLTDGGGYTGGLATQTADAPAAAEKTSAKLDGKFDWTMYYKLPVEPRFTGWCSQQTMIRVKCPKRALDFYTGTLGMRLISVGEFSQFGFTVYFVGYANEKQLGSLPESTKLDDRFAYSMKVPGCIELTWNHGSEAEAGKCIYNTGNGDETGCQDKQAIKGGFGHIGLSVPDVYAACERFKRCGAEFKKSPNAGGMKGLAFIKDPDGYAIEIVPSGKSFPFPTQSVDCNGVALP
eukprot:TRINITY_DN847_c0_g1_i1.p1 TRINITY_DN847_c0_g1~~TRINITY_DN847_c0_g1_i1.p1  ORF type:complete len:1188 (-),score=260.75 TRINITY_DN847_c0_g1_i1:375-3938(-)